MKRLTGFDHRYTWQDGNPTEHGSPAELCFKARHGVETVICRVPCQAILNALTVPDPEVGAGEIPEEEIYERCESLFVNHREVFRDLARDKIAGGGFALPLGYVRSILIGEDELIRMMQRSSLIH